MLSTSSHELRFTFRLVAHSCFPSGSCVPRKTTQTSSLSWEMATKPACVRLYDLLYVPSQAFYPHALRLLATPASHQALACPERRHRCWCCPGKWPQSLHASIVWFVLCVFSGIFRSCCQIASRSCFPSGSCFPKDAYVLFVLKDGQKFCMQFSVFPLATYRQYSMHLVLINPEDQVRRIVHYSIFPLAVLHPALSLV